MAGCRSHMRHLVVAITVLVLFASGALAEEDLSPGTLTVKGEIQRFGGEALDVVKTPIDTEGYGLIGTLAVGGAVGLTYVFDSDIREKVQGIKSNTLDTAADVGDIIGNPYVHLGVAAAVFGGGVLADSPKYRDIGIMFGEAALLADATTFVLKTAIGRARPFVNGDKGSFRPFQFASDYDSLPSAHASSSFAMASVLAATSESMLVKILSYSTAAFVGFSRMYQDKHWASDIVLGAAIGELCGRVVTNYHAGNKGRGIALAPAVSSSGGGLALVGRW